MTDGSVFAALRVSGENRSPAERFNPLSVSPAPLSPRPSFPRPSFLFHPINFLNSHRAKLSPSFSVPASNISIPTFAGRKQSACRQDGPHGGEGKEGLGEG